MGSPKKGMRFAAAGAGIAMALVLAIGPHVAAQVPGPYAAAPAPAPVASADLQALVAPIALYPDELLAVVLRASTEPLQVVQAARFLEAHAKDKSVQPNAGWSEPIKALLNYPDVVNRLNGDLDWMQRLGQAVLTQQGDVLAAVQAFRRRVAAVGNLRSDDKQTVTQDGPVYIIESTNPQVIHVPVYDPATIVIQQPTPVPVAYVPEPYPAYWYPAAAAAGGFFLGAMTSAYWMDWHGYHIDEDDIEDFQEYRQQSITQRQQNRQAAAQQMQQQRQQAQQQRQQTQTERQQQRQQSQADRQQQRQQGQAERQGRRQENQAGRQQRRQDAAQGRPGVTPQGGQDIRAALGGDRPGQGAIGGAGLGGSRPTQLPSGSGGFGGRQNIVPPSGVSGGRGMWDGQRGNVQRPGYGGGGQVQHRGGFDYGSGRNAARASDRGSYSRDYSGGGRQFSGSRSGGRQFSGSRSGGRQFGGGGRGGGRGGRR